jgi:hypothetical protein
MCVLSQFTVFGLGTYVAGLSVAVKEDGSLRWNVRNVITYIKGIVHEDHAITELRAWGLRGSNMHFPGRRASSWNRY